MTTIRIFPQMGVHLQDNFSPISALGLASAASKLISVLIGDSLSQFEVACGSKFEK